MKEDKEIKTGLIISFMTRCIFWISPVVQIATFIMVVFSPMCLKTSVTKYLLLNNAVRVRHGVWRALKAESLERNRQEGVQNSSQRDKHKYLGFTSRASSVKFLSQSDKCIMQNQYSRFERRKKEDKKRRTEKNKKRERGKNLCKSFYFLWFYTCELAFFYPNSSPSEQGLSTKLLNLIWECHYIWH